MERVWQKERRRAQRRCSPTAHGLSGGVSQVIDGAGNALGSCWRAALWLIPSAQQEGWTAPAAREPAREGPRDEPGALRKIRLNKEHKPSLATADPATEREAACLATGNAQSALPGTPLHTSFTPLPAQNHPSYGGDCTRVATLLLIKISTSLDKVIIEHENLWIRTQNWKFQKEKVD